MKSEIVLFLTLLAIYSCQTQYFFKEKFKEEVNKMKPEIKDKNIEKVITKVAKSYLVEYQHTIKSVDLRNILKTCHLDFEINLVKRKDLPASNHQIGHIIVGGLLIPGREYARPKNDLWKCTVGVVIKYENDPNKVSILTYYLSTHFDKSSFTEKSGANLSEISDRTLANAIFYNKLLSIIEKDIEPIKIKYLKE